ncbi:glucans biosynthesis glucosyltransferase MdoH [Polynucleobacter arcticus]
MLWLLDQTLNHYFPNFIRWTLIALFSLTLPWMVIGFWNAIIGFLICLLIKKPLSIILPASMQNCEEVSFNSSTALLLCIRNEDSTRVIRHLEIMMDSLIHAGFEKHFHIYILSDSTTETIRQSESKRFEQLNQDYGQRINIVYRCRETNEGYKAGNIASFCQQYGKLHDFAITLDADSFMTAAAIARLVRMMQSDPQLGILQGLVIGLPSSSAFTRFFQYGMRLGMRSYTMGSAWWQSDFGPYWGHNAIIRLAPFMQFCQLPELKTATGQTKQILSHDLIEAVLMRSAGFDVRVYPYEDQSWEENPPTLTEYIRRDLRWCEGNLQYINLIALPHLKFISRIQLLLAIFMFLGSPAWIAMMVICTISIAIFPSTQETANGLYFYAFIGLTLVMWYLPKIAGALNVLLSTKESQRFGGRWRFSISLVLETTFSLFMTPITWFNHTIFMVSLAVGHKGGWATQAREDHTVSFSNAIQQFWPHTILGIALALTLYLSQESAFIFGILFFGGLLLSIPLAVITSQTWLGNLMMRYQILSSPEEITIPNELIPLRLKALQHRQDY